MTVGKTPLERMHKLLSKLDSIRVHKDRGSMVFKEAEDLFHKFMEQVDLIFQNRHKPLKLLFFLLNDLILLTDIPLVVQTTSYPRSVTRRICPGCQSRIRGPHVPVPLQMIAVIPSTL